MQTNLQTFLDTLFKKGEVLVAEKITPFTTEEFTSASILLQLEYDRQQLKMPANMPAFEETSALWGATFLYRAVQLTMMRDLEEEEIYKTLPDFPQAMTPHTLYSVDLTFRYLPDLFKLVKGLSPDDALVKILRNQAQEFPFSAVGIEIERANHHEIILNHAGLKLAYFDRIIEQKDLERVQKFDLKESIQGILGAYANDLWFALK